MDQIKFTYEQVKLLYLLARRQEYDINTTDHAYCDVEITEHLERHPELRPWILGFDIFEDENTKKILRERLRVCAEDKEYFKKELIDTVEESYQKILFERRYRAQCEQENSEENIIIKV